MAKDLQPLIRLHGWHVDEKRRHLGELLQALDRLETQLRKLHEELENEQAAAAASPEIAGLIYGNYAQVVISRRENLADSIRKAEHSVVLARDELLEAYREQRKFEMTQEVRDRKEEKERNRLEQIELDEIGIEMFRHKTRRVS